MRFLITAVVATFVAAGAATAQAADPSCTWMQDDPADRVGATRTQTPEKALEAIALVRTGEVLRLGHVYDTVTIGEPPFGRVYEQQIFSVSFDDQEPNSQAFNQGRLNAHIGQLATQFDALGHAGHDLGFYNCLTQAELGPDENGQLRELGVENVRPFFTRALLLDFVTYGDVPRIEVNGRTLVEDSYVITVADIEAVLAAEGLAEPGEGDVVLIYTGWDSLFGVDNARHFNSPGVGIAAAEWLAEKRIAMLGSDTQHSEAAVGGRSAELVDNPYALGEELGFVFDAVHFVLITRNGIHLLEFMRLGHLADAIRTDRAAGDAPYDFLFVYSPLPIKGLAGAPGSPLAIR